MCSIHRFSYVAVILLMMISFLSSAEKKYENKVLSGADIKRLKNELRNTSIGSSEARRIVESYGVSDRFVDVVGEILLSDEETEYTKIHASFVLGATRSSRARPYLSEVISAKFPAYLTKERAKTVEWAIKNLGRIGDKESVGFLRTLASREYWIERGDACMKRVSDVGEPIRFESTEEVIYRWRECALQGICNIETPQALEIMTSLKEDGVISDMHPVLLENYFGQARRIAAGQPLKVNGVP